MNDRWERGVVVAAGISAGASAIVIRNDVAVASLLIIAGTSLILAGFMGPEIKSLKFGHKGAEFETHDRAERNASAEIADRSTSDDSFEQAIASDDDGPPSPSDVDSTVIGGLNLAAGEIALQAIFNRATSGELAGCSLRLYLYDADDNTLAPVGEDESATRWPPGVGATGTAYQTGKYVLATGSAASDGTYGLTDDQTERYKSLASVASVPVFNTKGDVIAVVTAETTDNASKLPTEEGELAMVETSLLTSRVLIELLQWFDDGR